MTGIVGTTGSSSGIIGSITQSVTGPTIKKVHYFTMNSRTGGGTAAANQFTITSAFTPLDPVTNSLWCTVTIPGQNEGQDDVGIGLRFTKSGGSSYDFQGIGQKYTSSNDTSVMSQMGQEMVIAAGTIPAGTYTVYWRTYYAGSNCQIWNPNSSDGARISVQSQTVLIIKEYLNP